MVILFISVIVILLVVSFFLFLKLYSANKNFKIVETQKINYEVICEQAHDALLVLDIVSGRIQKVNPSLAAMLGYSIDQIEQLSIFDIHPKEYLHKSSEIIADVWEKKGLVYNNLPFVSSSGEYLAVECSAKVAPFGGSPAIIIYARDIRERLKLEKEIRVKNEIIEQKNKDITDSINYAKRIQLAKLPKKEEIISALPQSFVLFKPKDIVSGDFYFFAPALKGEKTNAPLAPFRVGGDCFFIAAADCTGHGVPGAFMSIIGSEKLEDAVSQSTNLSTILKLLNKGIKTSLRQSDSDESTRDGMDIALIRLDLTGFKNPSGLATLQYAGANIPIWLIRKGQREIEETKATKRAIGGLTDDNQHFDTHELQLQQGDTFYIFTDGYADTFGGKNGKKLTTKKFKEILLDIQCKTMEEQEKYLDNFIENWQAGIESVDDILVIGVRL